MTIVVVWYLIGVLAGLAIVLVLAESSADLGAEIDAVLDDRVARDVDEWESELAQPSQSPLFDDDGRLR